MSLNKLGSRPGRPKRRLLDPEQPITSRVRQLVDLAHGGNLSDASSLTGISYPTLRDLYGGDATSPNMRTLKKLSDPYGLEMEWLLGAGDGGRVPVVGRMGLLPPRPSDAEKSRALREVLIPYLAWPMYRLCAGLEENLARIGPVRERPIVGEATGDAFLFRLTTFLMQPLLAAEKLGCTDVIVVTEGTASRTWSGGELLWVERLRQLGTAWLMILPAELSRPQLTAQRG